MKKITAILTALAVMLCSYTYFAFGAEDTAIKEWNGMSVLSENTLYEVTSKLILTKSRVLPKSSSLIIRNGGSLTVTGNGKLYINGSIIVDKGGTLRVESFTRFSSGSTSDVKGILSVREQAKLTVNGALTIGKGGMLYNYGVITSGSRSKFSVTGNAYNKADANITVGKALNVTGKLINNGTVTANSSAQINVSGTMYIREDSSLNLDGNEAKLIIKKSGTASGKGIINRNSMTAVKSEGVFKVKLNKLETEIINGVTYIGGILIVNKEIALPSDYNYGVNETAYNAFLKMKDDAEKAGFDLKLISSFRSYETQKQVYERWCLIDGEEKASMYSAKPGHSEHQTGLAFDITSLDEEYGKTPEGKWLAANCYKYGFIIRYPKNKTSITGYVYEPWHVRYLGIETAKAVFETGLCLEEFLGIN